MIELGIKYQLDNIYFIVVKLCFVDIGFSLEV